MKRREFLNLVVKTVGAAGLVKVYGGAPFSFAQDGGAAKVAAAPPSGIWVDENFVVNKNSGVVHWPHPKLFKHRSSRVAPQNSISVEIEDWKDTILLEPDVKFDKSKSGIIYENLALREIEVENEEKLTFNRESLDGGIEVMKIAVSAPENKENWRLYELTGRLVSLKNQDDPEKARTEFLDILEASEISGEWKTKEPLARAQDNEKFAKWHAKTVDTKHGDYRKKLINRVQSSKQL